jgi:hypothetical protein
MKYNNEHYWKYHQVHRKGRKITMLQKKAREVRSRNICNCDGDDILLLAVIRLDIFKCM